MPEGRLESGNRGDAAPLAPFGGTGAAEGVLVRVGPTTPTRAGRLVDASVDPTDARKSAALNVGREVDPASFIAVRKAAWAAKDTAKR